MKILDGKSLAARIRTELAEEVRRLGLKPTLGIILVGDDPASRLYVSLKQKAGAEIGVACHLRELSTDAGQKILLDVIAEFNRRPDIDGILVQFPLPDGYDEEVTIAALDPAKDADGFRAESPVASPLIQAILELVRASNLKPSGHSAEVFANSPVFKGRLMNCLKELGFSESSPADLAVVAVGQARFLGPEKVNKNGVVIDVGTNREGTRVVGDADAERLADYVSTLSPVPGGVGPLTVAFLMKNVVELTKRRHPLKPNTSS